MYIHTYWKRCHDIERRHQKPHSIYKSLKFEDWASCQVCGTRFSSTFGARRLFDEDLSGGLCQHLSHLVRLSPSSPSHASCWHAHASPMVWCPIAAAAYRVPKKILKEILGGKSFGPDCFFFFYILGLKSNCEPFLSLLVIFVANLFGTPCILQQSHGTSGIGYIVDVMSCCPPGFRCCDHWCDNPKVQPSHISQLHALVHQAGGLVQVEPCWCWSPGALVLWWNNWWQPQPFRLTCQLPYRALEQAPAWPVLPNVHWLHSHTLFILLCLGSTLFFFFFHMLANQTYQEKVSTNGHGSTLTWSVATSFTLIDRRAYMHMHI